MKKIIIAVIKLYQRTLSPDHGWFSGGQQTTCCFYPTCSQYMIDAIEKYGLPRGILRGLGRVFRCHPWSKGGHDPA